jgi:hypothetical protein
MKYLFLLTFVLCLTLSCYHPGTIFTEQPQVIGSIETNIVDLPNVFIYKSLSNATVNESIQIRAKYKDSEKILRIYERYDELVSYNFFEDKLTLILSDTSGFKPIIDTIIVEISTLITELSSSHKK